MSARLPLVLAFALALAGCAARIAELPPAAPPPPARDHDGFATLPAGPGAPGDTVPSPAARAVLATIPDPVPAGSAPAPEASAPVPAPATPATTLPATTGADTTATAAAPDTAGVPIPTETTPLGAGTPAVMPETPPPPVVVSAPPRPAGPDTCWHVQVGAPTERARGRQLLVASQSQLLVPMEMVHEKARYKVRSKECLSHHAAESLRGRAVASGFKGVFLVPTIEPAK